MVTHARIPERGDVVWVDFNPRRGREQAGRRPALTISPRAYNEKSSLALMCPITSQVKGYPFEVLLGRGRVRGAILADQVQSIDWQEHHTSFIEEVDPILLREVQRKLFTLVTEE